MSTPPIASTPLSTSGRYLILVSAFFGWFCAGFFLATTSLAMQPAAIDLLGRTGELNVARYHALNKLAPKKGKPKPDAAVFSEADETQLKQWKGTIARWFAWYQCAMLFGAASGGLFFGRLGDRIGRAKAMSLSILMYSTMAAAAYFSQAPWHLLVLWYLACTGVGGMWPNGVALVSEAWSSMSRPMAAGILGTSANIGIFLMATLSANIPLSPKSWQWVAAAMTELSHVLPLGADASFQNWRWMLAVISVPFLLGLFSLLTVPESPRWLAARHEQATGQSAQTSTSEIFRQPLLKITLVGIALATIPLIGGWGSANWMVPWAIEAGEAATPPNLHLKANVQQARALTGIVGSLLGGWIGSLFGRRRSYFVVSFACLACAQYAFWFVVPTDGDFLFWVAGVGFFSGIYFGWLPLFLPELFPTRVRSTGAGVSFNFGRILTAVTVFATGALMESPFFAGDYARIGRVTSLIFAVGMIVIWLAPETSEKQLED